MHFFHIFPLLFVCAALLFIYLFPTYIQHNLFKGYIEGMEVGGGPAVDMLQEV